MGLETATVIAELVPNWPLASDQIRQGDDHIRLIKTAIKNTFPNINAPVTASPTALNSLPADFSALLTELLLHVEHAGSMKAWDLANKAIPSGWVLCDGQVVSGYGTVPDLRDKFIASAGVVNLNGTIAGSLSKTTSSDGGFTPVIQGHAITIPEMPSHFHRFFATNFTGSSQADGGGRAGSRGISSEDAGPFAYRTNSDSGDQIIESTGGGQSHTHTADAVAAHGHSIADVRPPVYYMVWIVKVTDFVAP